MRFRIAAANLVWLAAWVVPAGAQCRGDFNLDGVVTIDELIAAVENALDGCQAEVRFVDNGDGTISDHQTGLMWEKKVGLDGAPSGDLHDADNVYPWAGTCLPSEVEVLCQPTARAQDACPAGAPGCGGCAANQTCTVEPAGGPTVFDWVAQLNAAGFGGYRDWRVPRLAELETLVDRGRASPAITPPFVGAGCGTDCSDLRDAACSCTASQLYWTATPVVAGRARAWSVRFDLGGVEAGLLTFNIAARAVRTAR
jgi:hypothetical protein